MQKVKNLCEGESVRKGERDKKMENRRVKEWEREKEESACVREWKA